MTHRDAHGPTLPGQIASRVAVAIVLAIGAWAIWDWTPFALSSCFHP